MHLLVNLKRRLPAVVVFVYGKSHGKKSFLFGIIWFMPKNFISLGPVPERRHNSIPGINMPYSRDNFIPRINSVPERRNSAIQGINLG